MGPESVSHNTTVSYTLNVVFVDGSRAQFIGAPATFTCTSLTGAAGQFVSGSSNYQAPSVPSAHVLLSASYTASNASIKVNRVITVD